MAQTIYENGEWVPAHWHHIIPKYAGGTDDPENLVRLSIPKHAEAHRTRFEEFGDWREELAWKGLAGMIGQEEIILRIQSEAGKSNIGRKATPEARRNISKGLLGNTNTLGYKHPEKRRKAQSKRMMGENNPMFGKHHPEERRKRIGDKMRGRPGLSGADHPCYGTHLSPERKKRLSDLNKGKKASPEARANMSKARESLQYEMGFPDGNLVEITNLTKFARENKLDPGHMWAVVNGQRKHHKGFTGRILGAIV